MGDPARIVVLGSGFAGIRCARDIADDLGDGADVLLVSEDNFVLFTPMLPQVASGMIETRHIVVPVRSACGGARFREARIRGIDPRKKTVSLWGRAGPVRYDYLVVALGSETDFFGMADVEANAYTMKTLSDAVALRNRAIDMLEEAENDPGARAELLCFVVAGGGFAGVETAGEMLDFLLDASSHYPSVRREDIHVVVLEAAASILPAFEPGLARFAKRQMEGRGIKIRTGAAVAGFDGSEVRITGEERGVRSRTLVWTAGVTPVNTIKRSLFATERGRIVVDGNLGVPGFPGVFAVGDCAACTDPATGRPHPPTAQVAIAQAGTAARNLVALVRGGAQEEFSYRSRGQMAVIGKRAGIATVLGANISGFWAWVIWRSVYLSKMPSLERRIRVMLDWGIGLFFGRDIARLRMPRRQVEKEYRMLDEIDGLW
ncbi:MAG: NAD(P)/FAD-dependent oxidoreductase [Nitrosopumilus sp.]|nr:NAD(P)/FAD-dependent oxidoreductase [Nitrosopumilus sp.]